MLKIKDQHHSQLDAWLIIPKLSFDFNKNKKLEL